MYQGWGIDGEVHTVSGDSQQVPHLKQVNSAFATHCLVVGFLSSFGPSCWVTGSWETDARSSPLMEREALSKNLRQLSLGSILLASSSPTFQKSLRTPSLPTSSPVVSVLVSPVYNIHVLLAAQGRD